jgi:hypothetical protein
MTLTFAPLPLTPSPLKNMSGAYPAPLYDGQFAFARVKGDICLVQSTYPRVIRSHKVSDIELYLQCLVQHHRPLSHPWT